MAKRFFPIHLILTLVAGFTAPAMAQDSACAMDYELIFELRTAELGSYNVWDAVSGLQDREENFKSGLTPDSGNTVVAGERMTFEDGPRELVLTEIDRRGRIAWEKAHTIKDLTTVIKILPAKDGYVVLGNKTVKNIQSIWLGFFDAQGALKSEQSIRDGKASLQAHDMIVARDVSKGYVLAASFEGRGAQKDIHSVIYALNRKGQVVSDKAYAPGPENRILGLDPTGKDQVLATGYIYGEDGRKAGWIMKLDNDGAINWQRQYPRGRGAELAGGADMLGKFIAVIGTAEAATRGGGHAGWLMVVGAANGDIGWQRYYTGDHKYEARDVAVSREGLISVMLQGTALRSPAKKAATPPPESEKLKDPDEDFVRLLTVNPRGGVFISDEYFNGEGAQAWQMILGPVGERILIGASKMVYQVENPVMGPPPQPVPGQKPVAEPEEVRTTDGWVAAAAASEPYEDPCIQPYSFLP